MRHFFAVIMLITILVGCNGKWSYNYTSGRGHSITTTGTGDEQVTSVRTRNGETTTEIGSKGCVEFSEDDSRVISVTPGGYLRIKRQTSEGTREIEIVAHDSGEQSLMYRVDGASAELDGDGRAWFVRMLEFVVHETPIGAEPRAERLLRASGPYGLLEEMERLRSSAAQEIYFNVLLADSDARGEAGVLVKAAQVAASEVASNSALLDILSEIAKYQTVDETVSLAIVEASEAIASNSKHEECLLMVAQRRSMTATVAMAAIRSAAKISSNSSKLDALVGILAAAPVESDVLLAYIEAAESISSTNRQGKALTALLEKDGLEVAILKRVAEAAGKISSSNTQEEVLLELIRIAPNDVQLFDACLGVVAQISSTSSQEDLMEVLLRRPDLDRQTFCQAADVIKGISSTNKRERLQKLVIERMAE